MGVVQLMRAITSTDQTCCVMQTTFRANIHQIFDRTHGHTLDTYVPTKKQLIFNSVQYFRCQLLCHALKMQKINLYLERKIYPLQNFIFRQPAMHCGRTCKNANINIVAPARMEKAAVNCVIVMQLVHREQCGAGTASTDCCEQPGMSISSGLPQTSTAILFFFGHWRSLYKY